jgi:hypothetical protein
MLLPEISYIRQLVELLTTSNLDSIAVGDIQLTKSKANVKDKKPSVNTKQVSDVPTEEEIMNWSLAEPIPHKSALEKMLEGYSEPKPMKQVRKLESE